MTESSAEDIACLLVMQLGKNNERRKEVHREKRLCFVHSPHKLTFIDDAE